MSASWASHLYAREICGCVENAGVRWARHARHFHVHEVPGNQLQEKFVDVLKKQALVGTARKAFSRARSSWESTAS